jgi:hypothetical protein
MRRLLVLVTTLSLALLAAAPLAHAAKSNAVIRDCTDDGRLQGKYTQKELRNALDSIPTDVDEYTNCREVIRRAAFGGAGGGGGGGDFGGFSDAGGDPLATATPQERKAVDKAIKEGGKPIQLKDDKGRAIGALVRPAEVARRTGPGSTDVPTPMLIAALLLILGALAAAAPTFRDRVLTRRSG